MPVARGAGGTAALAAAILAGLVLAMAPWWVRNARVTGHFVPTTLQVGASLYDGLSPTATGASRMDFVAPMTEAERRHPAAAGGRLSDGFEYRLDRRMGSEALTWAWAHPGRVAELAAIKLGAPLEYLAQRAPFVRLADPTGGRLELSAGPRARAGGRRGQFPP